MPDPIAAAFKPGWRLAATPSDGGAPVIVSVMVCQEAWRRLTLRSQRALLAIAEQPGRTVQHNTRDCLRARGLVDEHNELTFEGRAVVKHRPRPGKHAVKEAPDA
jgi:hypothetical protein